MMVLSKDRGRLLQQSARVLSKIFELCPPDWKFEMVGFVGQDDGLLVQGEVHAEETFPLHKMLVSLG
jgi:hypothetical protein